MLQSFCQSFVLPVSLFLAMLLPEVCPAAQSLVDLGDLDRTPFVHTMTGTVSQAVPQVVYKFKLTSACTFTCNVTGLTVNVDVYLNNEVGAQLGASEKTSLNAEAITTALQPGDYSITVQNKTSTTGTFQAGLTAVFSTDDLIVSGALDLRDPEFDAVGNRVTWRTVDGKLMVAPIDPVTGIFNLAGQLVLDTGLALEGQVVNGPEWAFSLGEARILYTKKVGLVLQIGEARPNVGGTWTLDLLPGTTDGRSPLGSTAPGNPSMLVKYAVGNGHSAITKWMDLRNPLLGDRLVELVQGGRWSPEGRSLFVSMHVDNVYQVGRYDVDTGLLTQLTTGSLQKISPFGINAPELGGELLLMTMDATSEAAPYYTWVSVYRLNPATGVWDLAKQIVSPTPALPSVESAEPFTFAGKTYVSFVVSAATGSNKNAEIWIASLDPNDNFIRRVSPTGTNLAIGDPESFVSASHAFIYYADLGSQRVIHRAATGLQPGPTSYAAWQQTEFGADAANPLIAGQTADPNNNGVANLLEYSTVHKGKVANNTQPLVISAPATGGNSTSTVQLQFDRRRNITDVQLRLESASQLTGSSWNSQDPATLTPAIFILDDQTERWTLTLPGNAAQNLFYRLRAQN